VIDITDPGNPTLAGSYNAVNKAYEVAVAGNRAFVADGFAGLKVMDITNPSSPTLVANFNTPGLASGISVSGETAFVADGDSGLRIFKVFNSEIDLANNIGQSVILSAAEDKILRLRLTVDPPLPWSAPGQPGIYWEYSVSGNDWNPVYTSLPEWFRVFQDGSDLRWRTTHTYGQLVGNPTVSNLTVDWLIDKPLIESITDIPNDQGRQVSLEWSRSAYDFDNGSTPILEYAVYRRIEGASSSKAQAALDVSLEGASPRVQAHAQAMLDSGWHYLATVPARTEDRYAVVVPTLGDSTALDGPFMSTFMVSALTNAPGVFYDSRPDSGYSVDDLAPGVPAGITSAYQADSVVLDWADSEEIDLQNYRIYRDVDPDFFLSPDNLVHEATASHWTDPVTDPWGYHYKVTAVDIAGNESGAGSPTGVSGARDGVLPTRTVLMGAVPNPFNPSTRLSFDLAAAGQARLRIYDTAGRLVATLVDERRGAGRHVVVWDGRDRAGRASAAGVYLYRLEAGNIVETKRMTLVK
jgi:hypothetical protein